MKKLLSFFIAGALAVGLAGCSGDLHDNNDAPIVERPTMIVGAMNYDGGNVFSEMVQVDELTSSYTFIYKSGMSSNWGSPADGVAFKVGYAKDDWDHCWSQEEAGTAQLADGAAETVCKAQNAQNIAFGGLTDGKTYKITVTAGIASVSVKLEQAADIPSYTLNANGVLYAMDYSADGEKGLYKVTLTPTSDELELTFFDGTDNYGSKTAAIDVSGPDTDKDGNATASNPAVVEKLSDTVTSGANFKGLHASASGKGYTKYIITLTVDGETKLVTLTRIPDIHTVTYTVNISGVYEAGDTAYLGGSLRVSGWEPWPFAAWNSSNPENTGIAIGNKFSWATADNDGKVSFTIKASRPDLTKITGIQIMPTKAVKAADGSFSCGWQTGSLDVPEHTTGSDETAFIINVLLTKDGDDVKGNVTIGEKSE